MSEKPRYGEGLIGAVSAGVFFLIIGGIFLVTPNLFDRVIAFFSNFAMVQVPNTQIIYLPAPATPFLHRTVYIAAAQFALIWGFFQIFVLILRFTLSSPYGKKTETIGDIICNFGAYYLISTILIPVSSLAQWFGFWALILMLIGFSLIVRAVILAFRK